MLPSSIDPNSGFSSDDRNTSTVDSRRPAYAGPLPAQAVTTAASPPNDTDSTPHGRVPPFTGHGQHTRPAQHRERLHSSPIPGQTVHKATDYIRRPSLPVHSHDVSQPAPFVAPAPRLPASHRQHGAGFSARSPGQRLSSNFLGKKFKSDKGKSTETDAPVDYLTKPLPVPPAKRAPAPTTSSFVTPQDQQYLYSPSAKSLHQQPHPHPSATGSSPLENSIVSPLIPTPNQDAMLALQQSTSWLSLDGQQGQNQPYYDIGLIPVVDEGLIPMNREAEPGVEPLGIAKTTAFGLSNELGSPHGVSGEALLFERSMWYSRNYADYKAEGLKEAVLKIYESPLTGDLRFSFIGRGGGEHHFEVPHRTCELVLAYAYETSWPDMVYLQKTSGHESKDYLPPDLRQILCMCRFPSMEDLADFQSRILREDMHLDISSTRSARIKTNKLETNYSGCRLQIWHEAKGSHSLLSSGSSFVTYDTVLSGPSQERTRPRYTRLLLFFSRMEEYLSIFITDNVEMRLTAPRTVAIKPRKYGGATSYWKSRSNIRGYHARRSSHAAGFLLGGTINPSTDDSDDPYDNFDRIILEFETQDELSHFTSVWEQAVLWRREQRKVVNDIEKEMDREQFTGRNATKIWF